MVSVSEFLFSDTNFWFSTAIGIVLLLFLIEVIGLVFGMSIIGVFDDLTDIDSESASASALASWLKLDKLPMMIWLVIFLTLFGLTGYLIGYGFSLFTYSLPPLWVSLPLALVAALIITGRFGLVLARILPKAESAAVHDDDFVGAAASITIGTARRGHPAEAKFIDQFSQSHYVLVEPFEAEEQFHQGDRIILIKKGPSSWIATRYK